MKKKKEKCSYKLIPENTIKEDVLLYGSGRTVIITTEWRKELLNCVNDNIKISLNNSKVNEIYEYTVPGAFELPLMAKKVAESLSPDIIICTGAIIKGESAHFEYISQAVITGLMEVQLASGIPIINGVLNCYNINQVEERCNENSGFALSLSRSAISVLNNIGNVERTIM